MCCISTKSVPALSSGDYELTADENANNMLMSKYKDPIIISKDWNRYRYHQKGSYHHHHCHRQGFSPPRPMSKMSEVTS